MRILYVISTPIEYSSSANMRNVALIKGFVYALYFVKYKIIGCVETKKVGF